MSMAGMPRRGFSARLRLLAVRIGAAALTRAELFTAELEIFLGTLVRALLFELASLALGVVALVTLLIAIALAVPEAERPLVLGAIGAALGLLSVACWRLAQRTRTRRAFQASLAELREDIKLLGRDASDEGSHTTPTDPGARPVAAVNRTATGT
jgi:uncharacterized membrane protein YqjE